MTDSPMAFVGSIPEYYDRYLGPLIFEEYAIDLARRISVPSGGTVLEMAAGTGIATRSEHCQQHTCSWQPLCWRVETSEGQSVYLVEMEKVEETPPERQRKPASVSPPKTSQMIRDWFKELNEIAPTSMSSSEAL